MLANDHITRLTAPDIGELWDSFTDEETQLPMPRFQEFQRHMVSFESDRAHAVSWAHLKSELIECAP